MNKQIQFFLDEIESHIKKIPLDCEPKALYQPVSYCLGKGGKRIRPLMTLLACDMFGGEIKQAMPPALGLELFHNFTLMHDDIMDNAPLRRNHPTVHEKWDANTAILSGDVLFAISCQYISQVPDNILRQILDVFYKTVIEVCEGQQYDMDFESRHKVSAKEYLEMIRLKTAVLPAACLQTGAIVAGAENKDQEKIYRFGECIGLAFQLRDDWLDVFGQHEEFGKQSGGDIIANKKTWLYIHALQKGSDKQKHLLSEAYSDNYSAGDSEKVSLVKSIYEDLGISGIAQNAMKAYYDQAFNYLASIDLPDARKEDLAQLAEYLHHRKK